MLKLYWGEPKNLKEPFLLDGNWVINGAYEIEFFNNKNEIRLSKQYGIDSSFSAYFVMDVPKEIVKKYGKGDYNSIIGDCETILKGKQNDTTE